MNTDWPSIEELMKMAQNQPEELEELRLKEIDRLIESAPKEMQRRLRGLQFQIDCKRSLHSNPLAACISISEMMLESFNQLNDALHGQHADQLATEEAETKPTRRKNSEKQANVLSFPSLAEA